MNVPDDLVKRLIHVLGTLDDRACDREEASQAAAATSGASKRQIEYGSAERAAFALRSELLDLFM